MNGIASPIKGDPNHLNLLVFRAVCRFTGSVNEFSGYAQVPGYDGSIMNRRGVPGARIAQPVLLVGEQIELPSDSVESHGI
jgi:hypothetical protein